MLSRLFCTIDVHQPDMRFRHVSGHRVVHCGGCGCEMIEKGRGRCRPSTPADHLKH